LLVHRAGDWWSLVLSIALVLSIGRFTVLAAGGYTGGWVYWSLISPLCLGQRFLVVVPLRSACFTVFCVTWGPFLRTLGAGFALDWPTGLMYIGSRCRSLIKS
jgi:hypothetical protein